MSRDYGLKTQTSNLNQLAFQPVQIYLILSLSPNIREDSIEENRKYEEGDANNSHVGASDV